MFSLLTFPIFLPFVLISLFSLFPGFGNLPLCSRLFLQIHYYYISEILLHNTFLPVKAHRVIMIYCPSPNKDESNDPTIISRLWVWIGCLVVKGGFSLMNLYCFFTRYHCKSIVWGILPELYVYQLTIKSPTIRRNKANVFFKKNPYYH